MTTDDARTGTTPAPDEILIISGTLSPKRATTGLGKRRLSETGTDDKAAFRLLDTFDGQVTAAGALVLETASELVLLDAKGSETVQTAHGTAGFVQDLPDGPVKHALAGIVDPLRTLLPIASGTLVFKSFALVDELDKTQARLSLRELTVDGQKVVTLAALQRLRGYDKPFAQLRAALAADKAAPLKLADVATHLAPDLVGYNPKPDVPMAPGDAVYRVANDVIRTYLDVARQNEAGVQADHDSEFLHDYRVALRKVRSVLSLFKGVYSEDCTRELKDRFSALMAATGTLRDLDVYLLERESYLGLVPESLQPGLDRMFSSFAEGRGEAQTKLAKRFRSAAYRKEIEDLQALFAEPVTLEKGPTADRTAFDFSRQLIWKRYRKVCKTAADITPKTPDEHVHELRIHCKKLRYLMEFFSPLFGSETKPLIKALKKLQDNLGNFNDYSVQQVALQDYLEKLKSARNPQKLEIAQSVGALIAVLHQRQLEERAKVADSFATFDGEDTRAGFRKLFKGAEVPA
ncbi:CHAD domain-containing protein [Halovulum sp. GXIMD14794]